MTFGEKVRKQRQKLNLTQGELAKNLGVTPRVISAYETGKSRPRGMEKYRNLAKTLELDVNYLLTEDEFVYRGKSYAEKLVNQVVELFLSGELTDEELDRYMFILLEAYVIGVQKRRKAALENSKKMSQNSDL